MVKSQNKTIATNGSVVDFLATLDDQQQREDSEKIIEIMQEVTSTPPVMWGTSIIGFGDTSYTSAAGREVDWLKIGFSPRKGKISLYVTFDASRYQKELDAVGKHKTGKGCIYINKLADVDIDKLTDFIQLAYKNGN